MRLLDHVAQWTEPFIVRQNDGVLWRLTGASDFALPVKLCPLRYVLADELVRTCTALGFSEGDEISACLDLVHLPAEQVWVEWSESARRSELARALPDCHLPDTSETLRAGALIQAQPGGRAGIVHTFWQPQGERPEPLLAAMETVVDLDGLSGGASPEALFEGQAVRIADAENPQLDSILQCARFRFDSRWQRYYASMTSDPVTRAHVTHRSLSAVAFDVPMLLALFLLLSIRADLVQQAVNPVRLNAKRARLGRLPLLEHIEVSAPVFLHVAPPHGGSQSATLRRGPRFHHVRGHIVRRRNTVYWRGPHWRGHLRLGSIRSRTINLKLS